ncbi:DUF6090 family protein [Aestuariivivens sediminis]|uniref:DUF6090 family protein n=1 Tax=Aestuariivivens sediminis TaxID=2913557 RepID=UPI001F5AB707|nr:DUF6090 family protein [Aestuariivivens sediminis]
MIKFFRKIRQKLLTENKFSKYLLYAIGEIILVVIGILIALSINNWNENLKNNRLKEYYLKSLMEDLSRDTLEINKVANWQRNEIFRLQKFKDRIHGQSSITIDTIKKIAQFEFDWHYYVKRDYNNNTFNTIISSGNIELFNRKLIDELMQLQNIQLDEINRSKNNLNQYDLLYSNYSTRYPTLSNSSYKNNFVEHLLWNNIDEKDFIGNFVALLENKKFTFEETLGDQREVNEKSAEILLLIEQMLNKDK